MCLPFFLVSYGGFINVLVLYALTLKNEYFKTIPLPEKTIKSCFIQEKSLKSDLFLNFHEINLHIFKKIFCRPVFELLVWPVLWAKMTRMSNVGEMISWLEITEGSSVTPFCYLVDSLSSYLFNRNYWLLIRTGLGSNW